MTTQDKIKALAELDGWLDVKVYTYQYCYAGESGELAQLQGRDPSNLVELKAPKNYLTSYDAIIPLIQKSINTTELRVKFLNTLRSIVGKRCPKNNVGAAIVSDFDLLFTATTEEFCDALLIATGKMKALS